MESRTERLLECQLSLEEGGSLRIVNGAGVRLAVERGLVWLTQESDRRDWMLGEGRSHRLEHHGVAIASALQASRITVSVAGGGPLAGLLAAARRLMSRRRARPESHALRDIGLESYQPGLAQQMLDERRRQTVGLL